MSEGATAPQRVIKRSLQIAGHRTSVSLEEIFWSELRTIALTKQKSVAGLVGEIDAARGEANLSSALRVFVLQTLRRINEDKASAR
jgi:predicted DNA-binding ribbon-helix-helix protein